MMPFPIYLLGFFLLMILFFAFEEGIWGHPFQPAELGERALLVLVAIAWPILLPICLLAFLAYGISRFLRKSMRNR